jgi:hypothetical protein
MSANLTPAETIVAYREGYDSAERIFALVESLKPEDRAAATRQTIRQLCIEHAELMASIKPRRQKLRQLPADPRDDGVPKRVQFGDADRPERHVEDRP